MAVEAEQTLAVSGPIPHLGQLSGGFAVDLMWYLDEIQGLACAANVHRGRALMLTWEYLLSKGIWKITNDVITWHGGVPNVEKTTLVDQEGGLRSKRNLGLIKPKVRLIHYPASWKLPVPNAPEEGVNSLSLKIIHQHT